MTTPSPSIVLRPADARGRTDLGWLESRHSFSFGGYHDPAHQGHHALKVINDDRVAPGGGFGMHGHRDMEIVSIVLSGALAHRDSLGHEGVVEAGGVQYMSAGSGIRHSEFNASDRDPVHFLQIWIEPATTGDTPRYADLATPPEHADRGLVPLVTGSGRDESLAMRQDAEILQAKPIAGTTLEIDDDFPHGWVQVISGRVRLGDTVLVTGDGAAVEGGRLTMQAEETSSVLVFRLRPSGPRIAAAP